MSEPVLILGQSGSGKSTSIRHLPPDETFIINVCRKELPFKGARKNYTIISKENESGNMIYTDNYETIGKIMTNIDAVRTGIKYIIIDDSQYLMVNEFMRGHSVIQKGNSVFDLYNSIGDHFWKLIWDSKMLRPDLFVFFLNHSETTELGQAKAKTIGKLLDDKVDISGMFTTVLYAKREGDENFFLTQNDGNSPAKSPDGMFEDKKIPNSLLLVSQSIQNYYEGE